VNFTRKLAKATTCLVRSQSSDIAAELTKKGFDIDRRKIQLHEPLKQLGDFTIAVKLHRDVTAHFKVVIEKEAEAEEGLGKSC